ncbi:MAG TPA: efflux RND transporter periplasmic adaptor subunit [Candidatus Acidoferrales bacterium]|nr:efflux RND transporter periplasmic adaptor subunit [Candidatus Acidoferrales bacterium]
MSRRKDFWRRRRVAALIIIVVAACLLTFGAFRFARAVPDIPSAVVKRGEFVDYLQLRGEVKATKSVTITAPFEAGELTILKIVQDGQQVKKGDMVVEFDTTTLQQNLKQDQTDVKAAEAAIQQSKAQARMKEEQDKTDLMKAQFDVESAKLDASKQEIVSKIEGEEAQLKLADTQQKLKETETKLKADQASDAADILSKKQVYDKAVYQVQKTERSLGELVLKAPQDGIVTLDMNWQAAGPFGNGTPFKTGDRAWPGAAVAELPDISSMLVTARVDETERGRLQAGMPATVRIDAIPDREFNGHISDISSIASVDFTGGWPFPRNFTMKITLDGSDSRLRPGMSTNVRVATERIEDAITAPTGAIFHKEGMSVAYVLHGSKFEQRNVEEARHSGDEVMIVKGLQAGERVALRDPTLKQQ